MKLLTLMINFKSISRLFLFNHFFGKGVIVWFGQKFLKTEPLGCLGFTLLAVDHSELRQHMPV